MRANEGPVQSKARLLARRAWMKRVLEEGEREQREGPAVEEGEQDEAEEHLRGAKARVVEEVVRIAQDRALAVALGGGVVGQ